MTSARIVRVPLRVANSYLVIGDKTIIVDTGDPGYSKGIVQALKRNGVKKSDVSMIFITHGHIDHYGSVFELKQYIDAPVAIQAIDEPYLSSGIQAPLYPKNRLASVMKSVGKDMQVRKRYNIGADIIINEELDLKEYGVNGIITTTPGHTLGSASLVLPDGKAVIGDLLVRRYFLGGRPEKPPFLHDPKGFKDSMSKLQKMGVKEFYPGHGKSININDLTHLSAG